MMSGSENLRAALEEALVENPDDLATHMAYADHLTEEGDPRGELIQVQLALEEEGRQAMERKQLQKRERQLLDAHEHEWLGELAPILLGTEEEQRALFAAEMDRRYANRLSYTTERMHFRHGWARGWLDRFECDNITVEMARKLGRAPMARLLRALVCRGDESAGVFQYAPGTDLSAEDGRFRPCEILGAYPAVRNLRTFQYGMEVNTEDDTFDAGTQYDRLAPLIEQMPRLEELAILGHIYSPQDQRADLTRLFSSPTLSNLRTLQYYHGHVYPLEVLAANPALGKLTHLLCFPHSFSRSWDYETGADGDLAINRTNVRALVNSSHLKSLIHLQLRSCDGGDGMVSEIIASGILDQLEVLDLRHGHISDEGARLLAACPSARKHRSLDLIDNRLTTAGIQALRSAGIPVCVEHQQTEPYDPDSILYVGDSE